MNKFIHSISISLSLSISFRFIDSVEMQNSKCEHSNQFKRKRNMKEILKVSKDESAEQVSEKNHGKGRSSINSIPPPKIENLFTTSLKIGAVAKSEDEKVPEESENIRNELCNAYRFVVNYGVFEPNFEWLPHEVKMS